MTVEQKFGKEIYVMMLTLCGMDRAVAQLIGCCTFNKPPWFCTKLDQHTSDDIELRAVCDDEATDNEDDLDN